MRIFGRGLAVSDYTSQREWPRKYLIFEDGAVVIETAKGCPASFIGLGWSER
jgi:hypothetical protein